MNERSSFAKYREEPSQTSVKGQRFDVGRRYANLEFIGEGAYGMVVSATDIESSDKKSVAIKKISPFEHQLLSQRTLREIMILSHFNHENVISILDIIRTDDISAMKDIYIVLEKMDADLYRILKNQRLTNDHVTYLSYQLFRGLKYIHSANVIHRDLKPSNILVNANCELKICDFGLARVCDPRHNHQGILTEYVATRWYRAPEVLLISDGYTKSMDIWSAGCILAEMFNGRPLFPGKDYVDQLKQILAVIGSPSDDEMRYLTNGRMKSYMAMLPKHEPKPFFQLYPDADLQALQLLAQLLKFSPDERPTAETALKHQHFGKWHDQADEPGCPKPFSFVSELDDCPTEQLKGMIFEETTQFYKRKQNVQKSYDTSV